MEVERGEEGGRRDREREKDTRERIIYRCRLPNNTKEQSTTGIHIPTSYMYRDTSMYRYTNIPEISTSTFPPRYHTNPSIRYTHHNTLLQHLPTPSPIDYYHPLQQDR